MTVTRKPSRQRGAVLTMLLIMIPVLAGFMVLSIEGGRFLRTKASLADAAEVATLAVSSGENPSVAHNKDLIIRYVETLMPEATVKSVNISRRVCIPPECDLEAEETHSGFVEYSTEISAGFNSLFPSIEEGGIGFTKVVDVKTDATVRKFRGGALDVVFVADFSGSMRDRWPKNGPRKIDMLKSVLADVAEKIETYTEEEDEKNTMALVPFHVYTFEGSYEDENEITRYCATSQWQENATTTVANLFEEKQCTVDDFQAQDGEFFSTSSELTPKAEVLIEDIEEMNHGWGTAVFEGIIRAGQLVKSGTNPRRLIIVLSDGEDSPSHSQISAYAPYSSMNRKIGPVELHNELVKEGYCNSIRTTLNQERTEDGIAVQSRIAVIGFDYDVDNNTQLRDCAGDNNVYSAQNIDDFYKLIIGLISEEIGHLYKG